MAMTTDDERLPCGVALEPLVTQVADAQPPADPAHQAACPYCQAALRILNQSWSDVQALTRQPVPIPPQLTAQIMLRVRSLARHVTDSILLGHPHGETRVSHAVVRRAIQRLAVAVPGVVFASVRAVPHEPPDPARLNVAVRLVVVFGPAIEALADAVRLVVDRRIRVLTGAEVSRIDITIDDIAEPTD